MQALSQQGSLDPLTLLQAIGSASPTRSALDKSTRFRPVYSLVSDTSPVTLYYYTVLEARRSTTIPTYSHADHRQPGRTNHQSEQTGAIARPAVQCPSGPTAPCAGGSAPKPRAAIWAEDRARETARKPGSPRNRGRSNGATVGSGERSGEIDEVRQAARTGKLDRAADECPDLASTAIEAERPTGAEPWSEDTNRPDRPPSAPRRANDRDQPAAGACPRTGSASATGDRREPLGVRCGLRCCSRWSA